MTRSDDTTPPLLNFFFLQIYTIHVNDLFQGENGEFRRKVTSLHPWYYIKILYPLCIMRIKSNQSELILLTKTKTIKNISCF